MPKQAAPVERALIALFRGEPVTTLEQSWFTYDPIVVRDEVIAGLRRTDPTGCAELAETVRNLGEFSIAKSSHWPSLDIEHD